MKTYKICVIGFVLGSFLHLEQGSQAGDKASELQGTWTVVSYVYHGEPQKAFMGGRAIIDGNKITFKDEKQEPRRVA